MLIDWFTVSAQIANFLILVWLLKRYLYKPILGAIDAREKRIASELQHAEAVKVEAEKEKEEFLKKNDEFDQKKVALFGQAETEAKSAKQRLLEDARREYESLRTKLREALKGEQAGLSRELIRRTQSEVFAITRKTLTDLASETLEERIVDAFVLRLGALNEDAKKQLASPGPALVQSAFELPQALRTEIETSLKATLNKETKIRFETAPDLISGIELTVGGNKVAWSIADYLASLERSVAEALNTADGKSKQGIEKNAL